MSGAIPISSSAKQFFLCAPSAVVEHILGYLEEPLKIDPEKSALSSPQSYEDVINFTFRVCKDNKWRKNKILKERRKYAIVYLKTLQEATAQIQKDIIDPHFSIDMIRLFEKYQFPLVRMPVLRLDHPHPPSFVNYVLGIPESVMRIVTPQGQLGIALQLRGKDVKQVVKLETEKGPIEITLNPKDSVGVVCVTRFNGGWRFGLSPCLDPLIFLLHSNRHVEERGPHPVCDECPSGLSTGGYLDDLKFLEKLLANKDPFFEISQ